MKTLLISRLKIDLCSNNPVLTSTKLHIAASTISFDFPLDDHPRRPSSSLLIKIVSDRKSNAPSPFVNHTSLPSQNPRFGSTTKKDRRLLMTMMNVDA
ncbi:hypothetical protein U1Q18_044713 [Sarracenia purpurea var. burkii]